MEDAYYKAMALADGELDSADLPELVHKLDRDRALMRAAQSFIDLRRNRIARLYARKTDEPVPQRILDTANMAPMGRSTKGSGCPCLWRRIVRSPAREVSHAGLVAGGRPGVCGRGGGCCVLGARAGARARAGADAADRGGARAGGERQGCLGVWPEAAADLLEQQWLLVPPVRCGVRPTADLRACVSVRATRRWQVVLQTPPQAGR